MCLRLTHRLVVLTNGLVMPIVHSLFMFDGRYASIIWFSTKLEKKRAVDAIRAAKSKLRVAAKTAEHDTKLQARTARRRSKLQAPAEIQTVAEKLGKFWVAPEKHQKFVGVLICFLLLKSK